VSSGGAVKAASSPKHSVLSQGNSTRWADPGQAIQYVVTLENLSKAIFQLLLVGIGG